MGPIYIVSPETFKIIEEKSILCRDAVNRYKFLKYLHHHFKLVSVGSLTDKEKQRRLHKLEEGQTLEEDQDVAMSLEDRMAFKIQRRIRIKFGRALRKAMLKKMNAAATRIQGLWRRCSVHMLSLKRSAQVNMSGLILMKI